MDTSWVSVGSNSRRSSKLLTFGFFHTALVPMRLSFSQRFRLAGCTAYFEVPYSGDYGQKEVLE